jgi:hypothetical protein
MGKIPHGFSHSSQTGPQCFPRDTFWLYEDFCLTIRLVQMLMPTAGGLPHPLVLEIDLVSILVVNATDWFCFHLFPSEGQGRFKTALLLPSF